MITKINFINFNFKTQLKYEEIKDLISKYEINYLSQNYFVCNKNGKIIEIVIDKDESGNFIIYNKGKIYFVNLLKSISENSINSTQNSQKELVIKSPMPGLISKINVNPGDIVKKGDGLLKIEAMKMENEIKSPYNGIIESVKVRPGLVVEKNAILIVLKFEKNNE